MKKNLLNAKSKIYLALFILLLSSCKNNELTKDGVVSLMCDYLQIDNKDFTHCSYDVYLGGQRPSGTTVSGGFSSDGFNVSTYIAIDKDYSSYGWAPSKYSELIKEGLIKNETISSNYIRDVYKISLTEKCKNYFCGYRNILSNSGDKVEQFVFYSYTLDVGGREIKVMSKAKEKYAEAEVLFKFKDISPIKKIFSPINETEFKKIVKFKLFDEGHWQITEESKAELKKLIEFESWSNH